jgi:hypothetical protein
MSIHKYYKDNNIKLEKLKKILTKDSVNVKDVFGYKPSDYLITNSSLTLPMLQFIVEIGDELNVTGEYGMTLLHRLCGSHAVTVSILKFAVVLCGYFKRTNQFGNTTLHYLCCNMLVTLSLLQFAINLGGDLSITNPYGESPLQSIFLYKLFTKEQIHECIKKRNLRMFISIQLLRYTICGPIILEEIISL